MESIKIVDNVERWLTRPALIFPFYAAALVAVLPRCLRGDEGSAKLLGTFLLGVFYYTWVEYVLHRCLFHRVLPKVPAPLEKLHKRHHRNASHLPHGTFPIPASLLLIFVWNYPLHAIFGNDALYWTFIVGFTVGYLAQEAVHHATHQRGRGWDELRRNHEVHHHRDAQSNYGFITSLWDRLFGTYRSPNV